MTAPLRLFLAINLPEAERRAMRDAVAPMRAAARGVSWVAEENLHLTLKFLGPQPATEVERLREALAPPVRRARACTLEIGGLGAFPNLRAPRVVWVGVAPEPRLELLHHDVEIACADLGYDLDGRPFRPHITLGRVRDPLPPAEARALADAARGVRYAGRSPARSLEIIASDRAPTGAHYTVMASLPMEGGS
jgi:RNA 2',3'-cyclic 3'-phosphodiesterase